MLRKTRFYMDTVVDIQVMPGQGRGANKEAVAAIEEAFHAFRLVEDAVSRFTPGSELLQACRAAVGAPVPVSPLIQAPLGLALMMAERTHGVFDPAIGGCMELQGFNKHYLTGAEMDSGCGEGATYRDIRFDAEQGTLELLKPMVIDLGAVAKGFAVDLAVERLKGFSGCLVNAGGDLYAGGTGPDGEPWEIGIRHPLDKADIITSLRITDAAVCTSGGYERPHNASQGNHHILNARIGKSPGHWLSSSIVAPYAMLADVFATAALLLDKQESLELVKQEGLAGIWISPELNVVRTGGMEDEMGENS